MLLAIATAISYIFTECLFFSSCDNNSSVGFGIALRNKLRNGKYKGRIYSIGVLPAYRSMGAGKLLLDAMEKYLIKSNVSFIVLETLKGKGGAEFFSPSTVTWNRNFFPIIILTATLCE